jgi:periplasmic protein TonB
MLCRQPGHSHAQPTANGPLVAMSINGPITEKMTTQDSHSGNGGGKSPQDSHRNPVCLEVTVGVRNMPAGPALVEGRTVIVFEAGAVIRLEGNPPVGQLLVLINPHGREVACRVIAPRNRPALKGYVEVDFCEQAGDFWGIHPDLESGNVRPSAESSFVPPPPTFTPAARTITPPPPVTPPVMEQPKMSGHGPTFEDIPGLSLDAPAVRAPAAASDARPRPRASEPPAFTPDLSKPVSPAFVTPLSEVPPPVAPPTFKPTAIPPQSFPSKGITGMSALPQPQRAGSRMPLIIGAVAVALILGAGGFFYFRQSSPVLPSGVSSPVAQESAPAVQPASGLPRQDQPVDSAATRVPTPDLNTTAPATASPSNAADLVRPASETTASFAENNKAKPATPPVAAPAAPQRQSAPSQIASLKISAPKAPVRNTANSSDSSNLSVPEIAAANPAASLAISNLMTTAGSSNVPAPPRPVAPSTPARTEIRGATLIASTPPAYPPMAKQSNIQGDVVLALSIDSTGKVSDLAVLSGPEILRRAAADAVRKWKYQPATSNGNPISSQVTVKVSFRVQ